MKTYEIAVTITDSTSVDANSEEEALQIAEDIFKENGLMIGNAELDIIEVQPYDKTTEEYAAEHDLTLNRETNTYYDSDGNEYRDENGEAVFGA